MSFMDRMNEVVDNSKFGDTSYIELYEVRGEFEVDEMGEITVKSAVFEFIVDGYTIDCKKSFNQFEEESNWYVNSWAMGEGRSYAPECFLVDIDYSDGGMTLSKFEEWGAAEMLSLILWCL